MFSEVWYYTVLAFQPVSWHLLFYSFEFSPVLFATKCYFKKALFKLLRYLPLYSMRDEAYKTVKYVYFFLLFNYLKNYEFFPAGFIWLILKSANFL